MVKNLDSSDKLSVSAGIVIRYDELQGIGRIRTLCSELYFKIENSKIQPRINTFVVFSTKENNVDNEQEAFDINSLISSEDLILKSIGTTLFPEKSLLCYFSEKLMEEVVEKSTDVIGRYNISNYLKACNIVEVADSYEIFPYYAGHSKFRFWNNNFHEVYFVSKRRLGLYISSDKKLRDPYLDALFPLCSKNAWIESDFSFFDEIMLRLGFLFPYKRKGREMTALVQKEAKEKYDKEKHQKEIESLLFKEKEIEKNKVRARILQEAQDIFKGYHLDCSIEEIKCISLSTEDKHESVVTTGESELYKEKLNDPRWKEVRDKIKKRDHWSCQHCFNTKKMDSLDKLFDYVDFPEVAEAVIDVFNHIGEYDDVMDSWENFLYEEECSHFIPNFQLYIHSVDRDLPIVYACYMGWPKIKFLSCDASPHRFQTFYSGYIETKKSFPFKKKKEQKMGIL